MLKTKVVLFLILIPAMLYGQGTCKEKLYKANLLYESGQLNEAIELAKSCTDSETESERWQAWHLLSKAYLATGHKAEARSSAEIMLEINPTYKPSKVKDPAELVRLLNSIKVIPKFSLGLAATIGGSWTTPRVLKTFNGASYHKEYTTDQGFQSGLIIGYHMNEIISLHTGLAMTQKRYQIDYDLEGLAFNVKEQLNYLNAPAIARFSFEVRNKWRVFGDAGIYTGRLLSSYSHFERHFTETGLKEREKDLQSINRRNMWEYGSIFGAGIMLRFRQSEWTLDGRYYRAAFYNVTDTERRYRSEDLFYRYYYLDDDLRLNNFVLSLSFAYNLNYRVLKN